MQRRDFLAGLAFAGAGCARAAPASAPAAGPPAQTALQLKGFFVALKNLQDGKRTTPINMLQIGDSHTANDGFSGRMRELMQQRFGDAGRGMLAPGIPFRLYRADRVQVTQEGFSVQSSFAQGAHGPFGISGLRQHADGPARMTLKVAQPGEMALVELEFFGGLQPGQVRLGFDDGPGDDHPVFPPGNVARIVRLSAPRATQLTLETFAGSVDLLSWRIGRATPGVTWSNLGTIGATVALLGRWDQDIVRQELGRLSPSLIVLAFGSNEGFDDTTDLALYAARYRAAISLLQGGAPGASILLVGPPDGVRRPVPGPGAPCAGGAWQSPPNLARIRQVQRDLAHGLGLMYWDWSAPMGGTCSMVDWAAQTPPLAAADHLHLLHAGYRRTAEALFADLLRNYEQFAADTAKN